jgi:hypothetical protein
LIFYRGAKLPIDLRRLQSECLIAALGIDTEGTKSAAVKRFEDSIAKSFDIPRRSFHHGKICHAKYAPDSLD